MAPRVPETIADYKILEEIGRGGMGTLYRARDPRIGRDVAIKLLREGLDDHDMRERFAREARSAGRLKHGNIVTIFELGEHNGLPFIAMEYVQGETLASFLRRRPAVPLARKLQIMDQVCAGLHYAHRMGIVHRDIKPANIMIDDEGTLKILDFGIARMGASKITQTGMVIGTLNYMAPEQMKGMSTDARADMFSIGAVFYELLSYRNAFAGDAPSTVMHKILYGRPEQLEIVCPNLDPALVAIVTRCLEKLPENRYADLGAVRSALGAVIRRVQLSAEAGGGADENDQTLPVPIPGIEARKGQTPGSSGARKDGVSMEQMRVRAEQTRARQIQAHIDAGRRALEHGDYDAAFAACEQALVLDPTSPQALDLEARARAAVDRQLEERISAARVEIDRGALTAASMLADEVLAIKADSVEANEIRREVEHARQRLAEEQERERERQRALDQALAEAQRHLTGGALDPAEGAIDRALALDPARPEAVALKAKIAAAREARRKADEEMRARRAIDEARRVFGAGDHAAAFSMLEGLTGHADAAAALEALKLEKKEIDRRRLETERRRAEAEAERRKLEAEAARLQQESEAARRKLEAELERLKREGEVERRRLEAETEQLKRDADAARQKRDAVVGQLKREAERAAADRDLPIESEPATIKSAPAAVTPSRPAAKPAEGPRIYQPPPRPPAPVPAPRPAGASQSTWLLAGGAALVVLLIVLGLTLGRNRQATDGDVATAQPAPAPPATPAAAGVPPQTPEQEGLQRLAQARASLDAGNYDAAIAEAERILALDAGNADAAQLRSRAMALKAASTPTPAPPQAPAAGGAPSKPAAAPAGGAGAAAAPAAPAPPPPDSPAAASAAAARARDLADRYTRARGALDSGSFGSAIPLFEQLLRDEPNYRDSAALLAKARDGLAASARQAMDSGTKLEGSGDLAGALAQYQRARQIDPSLAPTADQAIARLRDRMTREGSAAFTNARQFDALDRVDQAIAQYERAFRLLPDDDPNRKIAGERLAVLRARK